LIDSNKKTLVLDFGNILINLDYPKCFRAFKQVLGEDFSQGLPEKTKDHLFRYERGQINTEAFLWHLQQYNPTVEVREIISAWNIILGELPLSRLEMVMALRKEYNLALLSNINELHEIAINKRLENVLSITDFQTTYFDKVYYSHHIGMRKPDIEIYDFVANDLAVKPQDILFIDDMEENIIACRKAGWNGLTHNPKEDIINNISVYLSQTWR